MLKNILLVALGGAAGSVARYLLSKAIQDTAATAFPWGTMAVNGGGCPLIRPVYRPASSGGGRPGAGLELMLTGGLLGGISTFSTFANESLTLAKTGDALLSAAYIGSSVALGMLAVMAGAQLAKAFAS